MLKGSIYSPLSLKAALQRYEPGKKDYIDIVVRKTGLDPKRTIDSLNDQEFRKFYQAIEFVENWKVGSEDFIERWVIVAVRKKRGTIFEYLINGNWIDKRKALALAQEKRLRAIVVHPKNRIPYLRPEYGEKSFMVVT